MLKVRHQHHQLLLLEHLRRCGRLSNRSLANQLRLRSRQFHLRHSLRSPDRLLWPTQPSSHHFPVYDGHATHCRHVLLHPRKQQRTSRPHRDLRHPLYHRLFSRRRTGPLRLLRRGLSSLPSRSGNVLCCRQYQLLGILVVTHVLPNRGRFHDSRRIWLLCWIEHPLLCSHLLVLTGNEAEDAGGARLCLRCSDTDIHQAQLYEDGAVFLQAPYLVQQEGRKA